MWARERAPEIGYPRFGDRRQTGLGVKGGSVITQEVWMDIKMLSRQGMSIRAIARHTGHSRTTVRKSLSETVPKSYGPRVPRPTKLTPWLSYLGQALESRPYVLASRLYDEIVEQGYAGCYESVKTWVRAQRELEQARKRACVRFETGPGVEGQFDWKGHICGLLEGNPHCKVWIFRFVLCYSRLRITLAVTDAKLAGVLADLRETFERLGGVPQRIVFDNFKAAVIKPRPALRLHPLFAAFCDHYGVEPAPAPVRRPERKGKVERSFLDLEDSELLRRTYPSLEALREALADDDRRHAHRVHTTTSARPADRFVRESAYLLPLPGVAFDTRLPESRIVRSDCTVSYNGAAYSVPYRLVGATLTVKADHRTGRIEIFDRCDSVATHDSVAKGDRSIVEAHVADLRRPRWERARRDAAPAAQRPVKPEPTLVRWPLADVPVRPIAEYADLMEVLV